MIYKLGHVEDVEKIDIKEESVRTSIKSYLEVLNNAYGKERNIDEDDGGYVLYAVPETNIEEINAFFDISTHTPEWVNRYGNLCEALYLITNEFVVVVIMYITDAPTNILN